MGEFRTLCLDLLPTDHSRGMTEMQGEGKGSWTAEVDPFQAFPKWRSAGAVL